jgi:hypothetical protein
LLENKGPLGLKKYSKIDTHESGLHRTRTALPLFHAHVPSSTTSD